MKLKVYRYHRGMTSPRYDTFELEPRDGMTVLGALFQFQERYDDSLAFHYSCRGAVCGTCAMLIDKVPRLACRTQVKPLLEGRLDVPIVPYPAVAETVAWNREEEVLVEPLPHMPVIKDLVVDMDLFFQKYRFVKPIFTPQADAPYRERTMDQATVKKLEVYTNCILCAACSGACPVEGKNPRYLGPAALAKLYRFHIDPREVQVPRLERADIANGWWACEFFGNCTRVCPKGIPPRIAIAKAEAELKGKRKNKPKAR